jgi:hypothetical protein
MRSLIHVVLIMCFSGSFLGVFAQDSVSRSGFAVVTLVSGNVPGLIATETIRNQASAGPDQAILAPSPLITSASLLVPIGPVIENTTAIAIANPSIGAGAVNLVLSDMGGNLIFNSNVVLGPNEQVAKFLNEFFTIPPAGFTPAMLLTISSQIPVGIVALNFRGGDITSVPLANLVTATPVLVQPAMPIPPTIPQTVPPTMPPAGFGIGLPAPPEPKPASPFPVTVTSSPVPTTNSVVGGVSLLFPQVVTGLNWSTEIAIGNTSTTSQVAQVDFFDPSGVQTGSFTHVLVPARGVVILSADTAEAPSN